MKLRRQRSISVSMLKKALWRNNKAWGCPKDISCAEVEGKNSDCYNSELQGSH